MRVLRRGYVAQPPKKFRGTCGNCGAEVEAPQNEVDNLNVTETRGEVGCPTLRCNDQIVVKSYQTVRGRAVPWS